MGKAGPTQADAMQCGASKRDRDRRVQPLVAPRGRGMTSYLDERVQQAAKLPQDSSALLPPDFRWGLT